MLSHLERCQLIAQKILCSTWNAIRKSDIISVAFIKLNDICDRQSGRLQDLLDQGKNRFEVTYSYYHASYVSRNLPSARKNMRSQKPGKASALVKSLLVADGFRGLSAQAFKFGGCSVFPRTWERFCSKVRCRVYTASTDALFFGQLQWVSLLLCSCLSQQCTLRQSQNIWCGFRPDVLPLSRFPCYRYILRK